MFTQKDLGNFRSRGISRECAEEMLMRFRTGFPFLPVAGAATIGNGIRPLSAGEAARLADRFGREKQGLRLLKFVPASGAATRMFKNLFEALDVCGKEDLEACLRSRKMESVQEVFMNIRSFAFAGRLDQVFRKKGSSLEEAMAGKRYREVLEAILEPGGLNYGNLPKGLLAFHPGGIHAMEEHMAEGALYGKESDGTVRLHFTVSPEHRDGFATLFEEKQGEYVERYGVKYEVDFSFQKPSTDTLAVDPGNQPFRTETGEILFRPGGHGALLENLDELDADIIFIKNIDNVVPTGRIEDTALYKKALAGLLLDLKKMTGEALCTLAALPTDADIRTCMDMLRNELSFRLPGEFSSFSREARIAYLADRLDRPIRICGMVKNEGEPGGGPFWVKNRDGSIALQIAESSQFNMNDPVQKQIFRSATHFNPVDIVCSTRNNEGKKYDLRRFRDPETGFISRKSQGGKDLKALELPGLWNGAMAGWITVFVEVPVSTFNPVKTINDLLREEHQ